MTKSQKKKKTYPPCICALTFFNSLTLYTRINSHYNTYIQPLTQHVFSESNWLNLSQLRKYKQSQLAIWMLSSKPELKLLNHYTNPQTLIHNLLTRSNQSEDLHCSCGGTGNWACFCSNEINAIWVQCNSEDAIHFMTKTNNPTQIQISAGLRAGNSGDGCRRFYATWAWSSQTASRLPR